MTSVTLAPRLARACAIAWPCFPEERLPMYRTGSMGSCVGPDVTRVLTDAKSCETPASILLIIAVSPKANWLDNLASVRKLLTFFVVGFYPLTIDDGSEWEKAVMRAIHSHHSFLNLF